MAGKWCDDILGIPNMAPARPLYVNQVKVPRGHRKDKNIRVGKDISTPIGIVGAGFLDSAFRPTLNGLLIEGVVNL